MKNIKLFILLFMLCPFCHALLAQSGAPDALAMAEQMPAYPGGADSLLSDVTSKLVYPKQCADSGIQGKVYLRFIVNEDGTISNVSVVKGPHPLLNQSALEGLKGIAKFNPGMQNGKPVKVWYTLPVNFRIANAAKPQALPDTAFIAVDEYYPGGRKAFDEFVTKNLQYPQQAVAGGYEAAIMVKCKLTDSLKITRPIVVNSLEKYFDDEAIRLISLMPALDASVKSKDFNRSALVVIINFNVNSLVATDQISTSKKKSGGYTTETYHMSSNSSFDENSRGNAYGNFNVGITEFKNGNFIAAKKYFDKALAGNTRDRDAYFNRAITKMKLDDPTGACDDFKRAYLLGDMDAKEGLRTACK